VHVSLRPCGAPALAKLARVHPRVGVNVILAHHRLGDVDEAIALASSLSLCAVQVLRLKREGRALAHYDERAPTVADERALHDRVRRAAAQGIRVRVDATLAGLFGPLPVPAPDEACVVVR
jgi:MoaA/NifB/PqqE/SkfB family radical SAM enzyme